MNELKWFAWLFPLLFIIHDMEEIVTAVSWCQKGYKKHIPLPITPFGNTQSTAGLAVGVYEELLIECAVTLLGHLAGFYGLWYGLLFANIVHLILLHILFLPLSYRHYVPGEITAWLTVLPCCYLLNVSQQVLHYTVYEMILWAAIGLIIAFCNLKLLHKNIDRLSSLIKL